MAEALSNVSDEDLAERALIKSCLCEEHREAKSKEWEASGFFFLLWPLLDMCREFALLSVPQSLLIGADWTFLPKKANPNLALLPKFLPIKGSKIPFFLVIPAIPSNNLMESNCVL